MNSLLENKKGSIADPIMVGAYILAVAMTLFIIVYVWYSFDTNIRDAVGMSPANSTIVSTLDSLTQTYNSLDYMIPVLVGGLMLVSLVFAFKTGANVIYAFLSIFIWALSILFANVFTMVFEEFSGNFPSVASNFPILVFIMSNMKWITLGWVLLIAIVMFSRNKSEDKALTTGLETYYG